MKKITFVWLGFALLAALGAWYAFRPASENRQTGRQTQAPAAIVTTSSVRRMDVPVQLEANGYVSSLNSVDIRPQVSNIVARVHIKEGQFVSAGQLLFSLDDRADRVNLQKAEAQLAKDRASLADLERQLTRSRGLLAKGFIAQSAVDSVQSQVDAQRAALQADAAAVAAARVALSYQTIHAPSAGRAGLISVFPGSLVQPGMTAPMVTIAQLDPIAATFTLPETELSALLAAQKAGGGITVRATPQEAKAPLEGRLSFVDNTVDPQSGTIRVKAIFPNPDQLLWPGQYVAVKTMVRELKDAIVIPQAAIITGIDARTVYTVGPDNIAQPQRVELVYSFGAQAVVKGLQPGQLVVVDGKQNLRPGMKVQQAAMAPAV